MTELMTDVCPPPRVRRRVPRDLLTKGVGIGKYRAQ